MVIDLVSILSDDTTQKYEGQWIAIVDNKIVGADKNCQKVYSKAKKEFKTEPLLHKVLGKELLIV